METEPQPPQRNHPASKSESIQCPNCGGFYPQRTVTYIHPHTGKFVGVIIPIVVFVVIGVIGVIGLRMTTSSYTTQEGYSNYMFANCFWSLFAFAGAAIAFILYYAWGRHRLHKNNITRIYYRCRYCGKEWDEVQEPTAKQLS